MKLVNMSAASMAYLFEVLASGIPSFLINQYVASRTMRVEKGHKR
jgi:hypothetical protein